MMNNMYLLLFCLILGMVLKKSKMFPENSSQTLGALILHVPLPALCLLTIPQIEWSLSLLHLGLVMWIVFGVGYFFFILLGKKMNWSKEVVGCLILTSCLSNTAFIGFPVIETLWGKEALKSALFVDQAGSFLIFSTVGLWTAISFSSGEIKKRVMIKKIFLFPPFLSFLLGIGLSLTRTEMPVIFENLLQTLALLLSPLALITVGMQLRFTGIKKSFSYLAYGLSYKLFLAPLMIFLLYRLLDVEKITLNVSVFESGMSTMVTASILAASQGLRPKLAGMMVGVGVPLSALTLSFWYFILQG